MRVLRDFVGTTIVVSVAQAVRAISQSGVGTGSHVGKMKRRKAG